MFRPLVTGVLKTCGKVGSLVASQLGSPGCQATRPARQQDAWPRHPMGMVTRAARFVEVVGVRLLWT